MVVADDVRVIRRRRWVRVVLVVGISALAFGAVALLDRPKDADYTDLIAAAQRRAASDGDRVVPLPRSTAERWSDNGGPTWADAHKFTARGNARLAPVFDELGRVRKGRGGQSLYSYPNFECLYWPVVPHQGDRLTRTESMFRMCYQSTRAAGRPYAIEGMAVRFD